MFFIDHVRDHLPDIERIGAEALARKAAKEAHATSYRQSALDKLKRLAVAEAIAIERLERPSFCGAPRLDDPSFKRKVQDTAADLLFRAHLQLSVDG